MASVRKLDVRVAVRRCADGSELPMVAAPGGKVYVIAEEGTEYDVAVETGPDFDVPHLTANCIGAELKIDAAGVGYWKTLRRNRTSMFEGFYEQAVHRGAKLYKRFRFAKASTSRNDGPEVTDPEQIKAGRITVSLYEYSVTGTRTKPSSARRGGGGGGSDAVGRLPEGKKFFLAPSLKSEKGSAEYRQSSGSTTTWARLRMVGVVELRYETASTLMLRGVLSKSNPVHRQLLRSSRDPSIRALLGDSDDEGAGPSQRGAVKPDPDAPGGSRVKRERGGGGGGGSVYLDLTRPVDAPLRVGGRELRADEVAVCDLVSSDDERGGAGGSGGRWEVRKKRAIELEGGGGGGGEEEANE